MFPDCQEAFRRKSQAIDLYAIKAAGEELSGAAKGAWRRAWQTLCPASSTALSTACVEKGETPRPGRDLAGFYDVFVNFLLQMPLSPDFSRVATISGCAQAAERSMSAAVDRCRCRCSFASYCFCGHQLRWQGLGQGP
jgi:hypothetical protein